MHFYSSSYIHAYFSISYLLTKLCPTLVTLWTVACQAPLFMGISMQEYCSGLPFPSPGDPSDLGIEPVSPTLSGGFLTTEAPGKPLHFSIVEGKLFYTVLYFTFTLTFHFSSVAQSCLTLCDLMNYNTPGLSVHHQLLEFTQTHVH